jgi:hypothetical protein
MSIDDLTKYNKLDVNMTNQNYNISSYTIGPNEDIFIPKKYDGFPEFPKEISKEADMALVISNGARPVVQIVKNKFGDKGTFNTLEEFIPIAAWMLTAMRDNKTGVNFMEDVAYNDIKEKLLKVLEPYIVNSKST